MKQLEICVDTFGAAQTAHQAGADRLELCGDLSVGGLTPDPGLLERVMGELDIPVQVMIRPRSGGFIYTADELQTMAASIRFIQQHWPGIRGFVTGAILPEGLIDRQAMARLRDAAGAYPLTIHRAFDRTKDLHASLETCVALGLERILTSGGADTVDEGLTALGQLHRQAAGRIAILPGGGVRPDNARRILEATGVRELHLSGRRAVCVGPRTDDCAYEADLKSLLQVRTLLNENC